MNANEFNYFLKTLLSGNEKQIKNSLSTLRFAIKNLILNNLEDFEKEFHLAIEKEVSDVCLEMAKNEELEIGVDPDGQIKFWDKNSKEIQKNK